MEDRLTENCLFCSRELENAINSEKFCPYQGGFVRFVFSYGSVKFDDCSGETRFDGYICDGCAAKYTARMNKSYKEFFPEGEKSGD